MLVASGTSFFISEVISSAADVSCGSVTLGRPASVVGATTRVLVASTTSPTLSLAAKKRTAPPPRQSTTTTARVISRIRPTFDFFGGGPAGAP